MAIVRVRRWGRTLAFTVPHGYAREFNVKQGDVYEVTVTKTGLNYRAIHKNPLFETESYAKTGGFVKKVERGET